MQLKEKAKPTVQCLEGYWTIKRETTQEFDCSDPNWRSNTLPCIGESRFNFMQSGSKSSLLFPAGMI